MDSNTISETSAPSSYEQLRVFADRESANPRPMSALSPDARAAQKAFELAVTGGREYDRPEFFGTSPRLPAELKMQFALANMGMRDGTFTVENAKALSEMESQYLRAYPVLKDAATHVLRSTRRGYVGMQETLLDMERADGTISESGFNQDKQTFNALKEKGNRGISLDCISFYESFMDEFERARRNFMTAPYMDIPALATYLLQDAVHYKNLEQTLECVAEVPNKPPLLKNFSDNTQECGCRRALKCEHKQEHKSEYLLNKSYIPLIDLKPRRLLHLIASDFNDAGCMKHESAYITIDSIYKKI